MKDIKRRIKSVNSTKQITKAMELVASAKLRKAKERVENSKPYFLTVYKTLEKIARNSKGIDNIYLKKREVENKGYIVIAGDRGLAGGYNANALKMAVSHMGIKKEKIVPIGRKSFEYFSKRDYPIVKEFVGISEDADYNDAVEIAKVGIDLFVKGEIDELYLVFTEFKSALTQVPTVLKLLPLSFEENDEEVKAKEIITYEPSEEAALHYIIPKFVASSIYGGIIESSASEQGARRMAMESATDNAEEMIDKLELIYNRARQASITQEISEIVAGAEALN